tara:strand:+ start:686 stop:862 length:177 start_codon:yes stop_codon:yes gene_type:complete
MAESRVRSDYAAGARRSAEIIANAKAVGFSATSPQGLSALERGFYYRKLELEGMPCRS